MSSLWRAARDILLLLLRPQRFIARATQDAITREFETNPNLLAQFPNRQLPEEKRQTFEEDARRRTCSIRRSVAGGFSLVAGTAALGWLSGFAAYQLLGPASTSETRVLQIAATALLLGATLSVLGWEIQSYKGVTLPERVNRWIFRTLYVLGTYLLLLSISWSADPSGLPTVGALGLGWTQMLIESEVVRDLGVTLIGTFTGVLLAFTLSGWWQGRQARKKYADTLHSIRHDLAHLRTASRSISNQLPKGGKVALQLEAPVLDASLTSSAFQDRASHGLITCLRVLSGRRSALRTALEERVSNGPDGTKNLQAQIHKLISAVEYIQRVLDEEVRNLGHPMYKTPEDTKMIQGLDEALHGSGQDDRQEAGGRQP